MIVPIMREPVVLYDGDLHAAHRELVIRAWALLQATETWASSTRELSPALVEQMTAMRVVLSVVAPNAVAT